jgi:hypothetical protein
MIHTRQATVSATINKDKNPNTLVKVLQKFCTGKVDKAHSTVCVAVNLSDEKQGYSSPI